MITVMTEKSKKKAPPRENPLASIKRKKKSKE